MKIKLKSVFINTTNKDGVPYADKNGTPYHMAVITSESGNKASRRIWSNEFHILQHIQSWRPGDEVEVTIEKNGEYNNFDVDVKPLTENRVRELILEVIEEYNNTKKIALSLGATVIENNQDHIDIKDIPF